MGTYCTSVDRVEVVSNALGLEYVAYLRMSFPRGVQCRYYMVSSKVAIAIPTRSRTSREP